MKRSDEIIEALKTFFEEHECKMDADTKLIYVGAFAAGVTWADKHPNLESIWHDATEEPKDANWEILCQDRNGCCWVENRINAQLLHQNWDDYTEIEMIVRWAYISDLLPKGGEK